MRREILDNKFYSHEIMLPPPRTAPWAIHPNPKSDETLNSWVTRFAEANHLSNFSFLYILNDNSEKFGEIDGFNSLYGSLISVSGLSLREIQDMDVPNDYSISINDYFTRKQKINNK